MPGKTPSQPKEVIFCYDEGLPPRIGEVLSDVGYPIVFPIKRTKDEDLIPHMGQKGLTWITKDDRSKTEHEELLREANISVIWIRGLSHERKNRPAPISKHPSMKDILSMLVNKLDEITATIAAANGPRYFLLYMRSRKSLAPEIRAISYSSLREVRDRLAGLAPR